MKKSIKNYGYYDVVTDGTLEHYVMQGETYTKDEFMKKMFGKEFLEDKEKGALRQYGENEDYTKWSTEELEQYLDVTRVVPIPIGLALEHQRRFPKKYESNPNKVFHS